MIFPSFDFAKQESSLEDTTIDRKSSLDGNRSSSTTGPDEVGAGQQIARELPNTDTNCWAGNRWQRDGHERGSKWVRSKRRRGRDERIPAGIQNLSSTYCNGVTVLLCPSTTLQFYSTKLATQIHFRRSVITEFCKHLPPVLYGFCPGLWCGRMVISVHVVNVRRWLPPTVNR